MKILHVLLLLLLGCGTIQACKSEAKDLDKIPDNVEFREAIVDFNGHFVVMPIYDSIETDTSQGYFAAKQKIRVGPSTGNDAYEFTLDDNGKVLRKSFFFNSTNWTRTYTYNNVDLRTRKYSISNSNPNLVAKLAKETNKYGFVDAKGQWVIPPQWDLVKGFELNTNTSFVWNYDHPYSRWGIIDQKGNYLLKPTCVAIRSFHNPTRPMKICRIPFTFDGKQL